MKHIVMLFLLFTSHRLIYAQDSIRHFNQYKQTLSIGHGYYNYLLNLYDKPYPFFYKNYWLYSPVFLKYERFTSQRGSVSIVVTLTGANSTYNLEEVTGVYSNLSPMYTPYQYTYRWRRLGFGGKWNYYFISKEHWSIYGGLGGGFAVDMLRYTTNDPTQQNATYTGLPFYFAFSAGAKYRFSKIWGIYAEGGFDDGALAQAGVCLYLTPSNIIYHNR